MRCVVTGAAGFIGSHLCEGLLRRGHTVVGVDAFVPHYPSALKAANQSVVLAHPQYHFHALDLRIDPLEPVVADADVVFHLAAMPGLSAEWTDFGEYLDCNVQGTQRLLEATRVSAGRLQRFVFTSSSAVYGAVAAGSESSPTVPLTPYGLSKLAGEQLCRAYLNVYELPVVILRHFNVYGPRQRPDMALSRFMAALHTGHAIEVHGDGQQIRGNTYVSDCVEATMAAVNAPAGEVYNVGGHEPTSTLDLIRKLEVLVGRSAEVVFKPSRAGDRGLSLADITKIRRHIGWQPTTRLADGLCRQWDWLSNRTADHEPEALAAVH